MKTLHIVILFVSMLSPAALAATITFDGPPTQPRGTQFGIAQYSEGGFIFKPFGPIDSSPSYRLTRNGGGISFYPENGTSYLQTARGDSLEFYRLDGMSFDLVSVDLAEYSVSNIFPMPPTVTFNGLKTDGSTISKSFTLDGTIDGTGPLVDFQTFNLGADFSNLVTVSVPTEGYSLDNVVIVPEPTPLTFSLLGILFLSLINRTIRPLPSTQRTAPHKRVES